jgi:hypothetical protein
MANDEVWTAFCDAYNGIRDVFVLFDQTQAGAASPPQLADEWKAFVRAELNRVVRSGIG